MIELGWVSQSPVGGGIAFILGMIWGSFFNVCIYRIPREIEIVWQRSFCPKCKHAIPAHLNIPVVSYLWLRGRCRFCKARISIEYPLVELAAGGLFLWTYIHFAWSLHFVLYSVFLSALLVVSVIDLHHQIIPDEISLSGIVIGCLASFFLPEIEWWESLLGVFLGGGSFFLIAWGYEKIAKRDGLGGGDVKLLAMIGAWLGYKSILPVILISSAAGSVVGVALMILYKRNLKTAIPFGPYLALAALVYTFWGEAVHRILFPVSVYWH